MSAALTLANGVEEAFLGLQTDVFVAKLDRVFVCGVFVGTGSVFIPDMGNDPIIAFAKKSTFF